MNWDLVKMVKYANVKGTKDLFFEDIKKFRKIIDVCVKVAESYGFSEIYTPIMEFEDLFIKNIGEDSDIINKEIYSFLDRNEKKIALRPEGTAPVVRSLISNGLLHLLPLKFFYYGPMFRYERPQQGRQRQFHQFGIEYLGADSFYNDVEIIKIADNILNNLNIKKYKLEINYIGTELERGVYKKHLKDFLTKYFKELSEDSKRRFEDNPLRILDSKNEIDKQILVDAPKIIDFIENSGLENFENIQKYLKLNEITFNVNYQIVRGLDYYNNLVFEFSTLEEKSQNAIIAGGRYDKLIEEMGGGKVNSVGFGIGIERLMISTCEQIMEEKNLDVAVCKISDESSENNNIIDKFIIELTNKIRSNNLKVNSLDCFLISKSLKIANKKNINTVIIVGIDEVCNKILTIKHMETGMEEKIKYENIVDFLKGFIK
jgi:histidyl-tRNA synthetase